MKHLLLMALVFTGFSAHAQVQPEQIFGTIWDIIQDKINEDKGVNNPPPVIDNEWNYGDNKVLLQQKGDQILLGRLSFDRTTDFDVVDLPRCNASPNQRIDRLRFAVQRGNLYVERLRVTFQNGQTQVFDINDDFMDGDRSAWIDLRGANRCIKRIRMTGELLTGPSWSGGNNNGNFNIHFGNNNGPNKNRRAVVNFVGRIERQWGN